jgi:hypothetical protein
MFYCQGTARTAAYSKEALSYFMCSIMLRDLTGKMQPLQGKSAHKTSTYHQKYLA